MSLKKVLPSRWRVGWLASLVFLALFSSTAWAEAEFVEGSLLAQFKADVAVNSLETKAALSAMGIETQEYFEFINAYVLRVDNSVSSTTGALDALNQSGLVEYAEPNYILHAIATTPNDPSYSKLWGMNNTGQTGGTKDADIDAPEAWNIQKDASGIVVATIDTGIDYNHPDLKANMWVNPGETPNNGKDDDGNGYIDDVHGINCIKNNGNPMDDHYHGTHVAGTIGAVGNNRIGVVGVAWKVKHMALKFLNSSGSGSLSDAIQCIEYMVKMKTKYGVNVKLSNNSWGGGGYSQALYDAIKASGAAGQLFMAAAGNSNNNNDSRPSYPSSYNLANIVAIGATDHNDRKASFSSYGKKSVDLGAPGVNIYSTSPRNSYRTLSGTSMATPHVSGAAAVLWANKTSLTPAQVKQCLMDSVDKKTSLTPYWISGGRLNLYNALKKCGGGSNPGVPGKATLISPKGDVNTVTPTYKWQHLTNAENYLLQVNDSEKLSVKHVYQWYSAADICKGTICSVTPKKPLNPGHAVWWVRGSNGHGVGPWSNILAFTVKVGGMPGKVTLVSPKGQINTNRPSFIWNADKNTTHYHFSVNELKAKNQILATQWYTAKEAGCASGTGQCKIVSKTPLKEGVDYTWRVQTSNPASIGPWSESFTFKIDQPKPPGKATLVSPKGQITNRQPTYIWNAVKTASWYYIWVSKKGVPKAVYQKWFTASQVGCSSGTGQCKTKQPASLKDGAYTWWIKTWNKFGHGPWSSGMKFNLGEVDTPVAVLISPKGSITDATPTYMWTGSPKVTWYYLWVAQVGGSSNATSEDYLELNEVLPNPPQDDISITAKPVIKKWYTAAQAGCAGGSACKVTPTTQLNDGNYLWYVRTWNSKGYGDWSVPLNFTLKVPVTCGFNEQFSGSSAPNWKQDRGTWTVKNGSYSTPGKVTWATTTYNGTFTDFEYKARLWRDGDIGSNNIQIRASGGMMSDGFERNVIIFQYVRDGAFSVFQRVNGTWQLLKTWTKSSAIHKGSAWNELRVIAKGTSLKYYINNTLVWSGNASSLIKSGRVGISVATASSSGQRLHVDWAMLTCIKSSSHDVSGVSDSYIGEVVSDDVVSNAPAE